MQPKNNTTTSSVEELVGKLISEKTKVSWDVTIPKILPPIFFIVSLSSTQQYNQLNYTTIKIEVVSKNNTLLTDFVNTARKIIVQENQYKHVFRSVKITNISREHSFDNVFGYKQSIDLRIIEK